MNDSADREDLTQLVPRGVLRAIKDHFKDEIRSAVQSYRFNEADEDSLTGALGQALSTPERVITVADKVRYSFSVESHKILGKGPGTPEKRTGADGIFQVRLWEGEQLLFHKGLPFQSKKKILYRQSAVMKQAQQMYKTSKSGLVLRFDSKGYDAADVRRMLDTNEDEDLQTTKGFVQLHEALGEWFLKCHIGRMGLSFDRKEPDPNVDGEKGFWVIDTSIHATPIY